VQVALVRPMGNKRGRGQGSFVGDTRQQTVSFYRDTVQRLKPWRAAAPKLQPAPTAVDEDVAQPDPPRFSEPYGRLPGEAPEPQEPYSSFLAQRRRQHAHSVS
jgi:hypothetical protein